MTQISVARIDFMATELSDNNGLQTKPSISRCDLRLNQLLGLAEPKRSPTDLSAAKLRIRMKTIFGTFYWTGHLPDDDDVQRVPKPVFSGDYGEQWQYMATEPVIQSLCDALRLSETITHLCVPSPEDHGWYTYFKLNGWTSFLYVKWVPDGNRQNCFEFDVYFCNNWWHRMIHWSSYGSQSQAIRTAIANALNTANQIEGVVFSRRAV